jgi:intracellular sulfur oxidation DsrE/DsrF family protein
MKKILFILFLINSSLVVGYSQYGNQGKYKVVIQIASESPDQQKSLFTQLANIQKDLGDSVEIEVVVHGPAIGLVMTEQTTQKENIYKYKNGGVTFAVCENTLRLRNITKEQILPQLTFVKSAMVELIKKQHEGWAYVKAGF